MDVIKWRESYETGIGLMDLEHKKLIEIINRLFQIIRDKDSYDELKTIYHELVDYTEKHFQHEEELLDASGYPMLAQQQALHKEFKEMLDNMGEDLLSAKESAAPRVYKLLRDWWLGHIVGEDKLYGPFLNKM